MAPGPACAGRAPTLAPRCQYPYPPEPADGLDAGTAEPDTVTSCQTPPETLSPLPLAWPGAASPAYVYSGCPP